MRERGGLSKALVTYVAIGFLWAFIVNVGAAVTGAPSAFVVLGGAGSVPAKAAAVVGIIGRQVLLWPVELYERVMSTLFG